MMSSRRFPPRFGRLALVLAPLALAGCSTANDLADAVIEEPLRAIGLAPDNRPQIDYTPRSPLVMPASTDLATPMERREEVALDPQWPNDPDVLAARERELRGEQYRRELSDDRNGRGDDTMTPDQLDRWARDAGIIENTNASPDFDRGRTADEASQFDPTERSVVEVQQPIQRRSLTEPPLEYRVPAEGGTPVDVEEEPRRRGWLARSFGL